MSKLENAYKTIGEVAKILNLNQMIKELYRHMSLDFGKLNLNKLNQRY